MLAVTAKPVMVQANAGLPHVEDSCTVFDIDPQSYADAVANMVEDGVSIIGGCCGTNPDYIRLLADIIANRAPQRPAPVVYGHGRPAPGRTAARQLAASFVIGGRRTLTGKNAQAALREDNLDYVVGSISQQEQGADVLTSTLACPHR